MAFHMHLWDVAWKTVFFYLFLLALLRVTGKREIGALNAIDLVGLIMISEAAIISIADGEIPFVVGVTPVVLLGVLAWGLAYLSLKDKRVRKLVEGEPSILVAHGRIDQKKLRQLRYNVGDLMAEMRTKNVPSLADVEFAVLETTGKLSIVPRAGARPVTPDDLSTLQVAGAKPSSTLPTPGLPASVVMDGQVDEEALKRAEKDRTWLEAELQKQQQPPVERLLLAVIDPQGKLMVQAKDDRQAEPPTATGEGGSEKGGGPAAHGGGEGGGA